MVGGTGTGPVEESYRGYDIESKEIYDEVIYHLDRAASKKNLLGKWQYYFFDGNTENVRTDPENKRVELSAGLDIDIVRGIEQIIIDEKGDIK